MPKLSVVVIIYKIEKYLKQCVDSVLAQTYTDFELILVDDGSPDNCPLICDEYAKRDKRVKIIHQDNHGSVTARWNGLLASQGEFVSLIDGDDWLDSNMYEKMIELAEQNDADIVITGYKEGTEETYKCKRNNIDSGLYSGDKISQIYDKALYTGKFYEPGIIPALWNKLIRRKLFFENYQPANPLIKMGDDAAVSYPIIAEAKRIVIANELHPYHYRVVEGSLSRKYEPEYLKRITELIKSLAANLEKNASMYNQLKYYDLFMLEVGLMLAFRRDSGLSFYQKKCLLKDFYSVYEQYVKDNYKSEEIRNITKDKKILFYFMQGKLNKLIGRIYVEKALRKVNRYNDN